jgi:hypothetical protein
VEDDNKSVAVFKVDGPGATYFRNSGYRKINDKNGPGNVYFKGGPPSSITRTETERSSENDKFNPRGIG